MGFGIRIMPGVRIRASSRGISAGIGPRVARVHVGSRGVGVSSGIGPFSAYSHLGGGGRRRSGGGYSISAYEREVRRAERQQELDQWYELNQRLIEFGHAHKQSFPAAERLVVSPQPVDRAELQARFEQEALDGVSWYRRAERRAATEQAAAQAEQEAQAEERRRADAARRDQVLVDEYWQHLLDNNPERVLGAIEEAFEDNEAPAAAIDCQGDSLTLVMRFPPPDTVVPEREVGLTPTGRPTSRKRTKTARNDLYTEVLASNALATVKEAIAVAPGINEARLLVIRDERTSDNGHLLTPLYCGRFERRYLDDLDWQHVDPLTEIEDAEGLINPKGRTRELAPLDLIGEPDVRSVVEEIATGLGMTVNPEALTQPRAGQAGRRPRAEAGVETRTEAVRPDTKAKRGSGATDLLRGLESSDADVRYEAVSALRAQLDQELFEPLLGAMDDSDSFVRRVATGAVGELRDPRARPRLLEALKDPDSDIRYEAVAALTAFRDPETLGALRQALDDPDEWVRKAAATACER
jgi:hypothetical protein